MVPSRATGENDNNAAAIGTTWTKLISLVWCGVCLAGPVPRYPPAPPQSTPASASITHPAPTFPAPEFPSVVNAAPWGTGAGGAFGHFCFKVGSGVSALGGE